MKGDTDIMPKYKENQLLVSLKAYSRAAALPLDASEVWESLAEAQGYIKEANAYGGQTIKAKLEDGKFHTYTLQPSESGYTLEEIGSSANAKQYVMVVEQLPESKQEQGILYINKADSTGYIWNGSGWQVVFKEISTEFDQFKDKVTKLEAEVKTKAPINNPTFTGKVMIGENEVAVKSYVDGLIANLSTNAPGVVDDAHPLPANGYKAGQTWRVAKAGTYAGNKCEAGDLIICIKAYAAEGAGNADFMVVQANIDGAVTSTATTSTVGDIVVFDAATGRVIKSSGVNIASLNDAIAKSHEHSNKAILDTYDKDQTALLKAAKTEAQVLVDAVKKTLEGKADKATTLEGYGITDAYTKAEVEGKLKTLSDNINTKVDANTVDEKVNAAKQEVTTAYTQALSKRIGEIPESTTVKEYIDTSIGAGGTSSAEAIAQAKAEAIETAKNYTNQCLTVIEF